MPKEHFTLLGEEEKLQTSKRKRLGVIVALVGLTSVLIVVIGVSIGLTLKSKEENRITNPSYEKYYEDFMKKVEPLEIKATMEYYSRYPHIAGSAQDKHLAEFTKQKFESFGLKTTIQEIPILLSYPIERNVELVYPEDKRYNLTLKEDIVDDGTSGNPGAIDTWNGYSASGEATGEIVYANFGTFEDYEAISHINLTGKIVLVRYGRIFRGDKAKMAQDRGAVGVLIFVDPGVTGYLKGTVYPNGPWSSNSTVQRGSVWLGNGDPATPGWASSWDSPSYSYQQAQQDDLELGSPLPRIPIQPISYGDAGPLIATLSGNPIPDKSWAGGFNISYVGPGTGQVHMKILVNNTVTPIWNVVARVDGTVDPDRLVIIGSHRDAWTMGAGDPISGTSVLMETARGIGLLLEQGWEPKRTILICSWDAEEFGLIGSIEFVETYLKTLSAQAVVYLNVDIAVEGRDYYRAAGSPSMNTLLREITKQVKFSDGKTVHDIWNPDALDTLGSGSDYTGFIQHVGIASLHMEFGSNERIYDAVYHSNYDSFYWFEKFGDPTFEYHAAMVKVYGLTALRFADDEVIPFDYEQYANSLKEFVNSIVTYNVSANANFTLIRKSADEFLDAAKAIAEEIKSYKELYAGGLRALNDRLMLCERAFLGTPEESGREWYLHVIFAPSTKNSYAGQELPGLISSTFDTIAIWSAMLEGDYNKASFVSKRIGLVIRHAAEFLKGSLWRF